MVNSPKIISGVRFDEILPSENAIKCTLQKRNTGFENSREFGAVEKYYLKKSA